MKAGLFFTCLFFLAMQLTAQTSQLPAVGQLENDKKLTPSSAPEPPKALPSDKPDDSFKPSGPGTPESPPSNQNEQRPAPQATEKRPSTGAPE